MGFAEKFNRYYTNPSWKPSKTVYVSRTAVATAPPAPHPSRGERRWRLRVRACRIYFTRGKYQGCFEFSKETSGTYDEPIILYAERNEDKSLGVALTCCNSGRQEGKLHAERWRRQHQRQRAGYSPTCKPPSTGSSPKPTPIPSPSSGPQNPKRILAAVKRGREKLESIH